MNKKLKYIIFIISLLIFISGCKNNATSPSTIYGIGKYRGTWFADNFDMLDLFRNQWVQSETGMTIKINSDTDMVINNIVPTSIKHLPDTVDTYHLYISTADVPPEYPSSQIVKAYYKLEFTSYNSVKVTMVIQFIMDGNSINMAIQKAELKK
ncbi:hypothetical protein Bint_0197 [Brachyspira intermedia PWS/A]|uniref:Lipoprotein n=1 Tax=Brachyspira intermedia (strain ATCC 51140 / PWS/A) TaxID=1045858 RepID=G0EQC6_BRAIP|nr:hypothetical protein [Brachyspira intermedia]AEM20831.1 hypothetical protein Bint_0197 [Brachyspira intermedia PWS/A]